MKKFDKKELFNKIDQLSIKRENDTIVTKYGSKIIKSVGVSERYEIFDFPKYVKKMVDKVDATFDIKFYSLIIKGGIQQIRLFSDVVKIGGKEFFKAIYILNSSDRTRVLNFDFGLYSKDDFISIITKDASIRRKHVTGIVKKVKESVDLDASGFNDVMTTLQDIENKSIKMSKVEKVVLDANEDGEVKSSNYLKLDAVKRMMSVNMKSDLSAAELGSMVRKSENFSYGKNGNPDFEVDAFKVVMNYMNVFKTRDSYTIKRESMNILNVTKEVIRKKNLESILGI